MERDQKKPNFRNLPSEDMLYKSEIPWYDFVATLWEDVRTQALVIGKEKLQTENQLAQHDKKDKRKGKQQKTEELEESLLALEKKAETFFEQFRQNPDVAKARDVFDEKWLKTILKSGTAADQIAAFMMALKTRPLRSLRCIDLLISLSKRKQRAGGDSSSGGSSSNTTTLAINAIVDLMTENLLPDRKLRNFSDWSWDLALVKGMLAILSFESEPHTSTKKKQRSNKKVDAPIISKDLKLATERLMSYVVWERDFKQKYAKFVSHLRDTSINSSIDIIRETAVKSCFKLLVAKPEKEATLLQTIVNKFGDSNKKIASGSAYMLQRLLEQHSAMKAVVVAEVKLFVLRPNLPPKAMYYGVVFLNQILLNTSLEDRTLARQLVGIYSHVFSSLLKSEGGIYSEPIRKKMIKKRKKKDKKKKESGKPSSTFKAPEAGIDSRLVSALLTGLHRAIPYARYDLLDSATREEDAAEKLLLENHIDNLYSLANCTVITRAIQSYQVLMHIYQNINAQNESEQSNSSPFTDRFFRAIYSILLKPELARCTRKSFLLNIVYRAILSDKSCASRQCAFIKRLVQISAMHEPNFICAALFVVSEIIRKFPELWTMFDNLDAEVGENGTDLEQLKKEYDPKLNEPKKSGAEYSCLWEFVALSTHWHPTVSLFAKTLLSHNHIDYRGDPLKDFTTVAYLERIVMKNPRQQHRLKGGSVMQSQAISIGPVKNLISLKENRVPAQDLFFYRYLSEKSKRPLRAPKNKDAEIEDELDDAEIDKALGLDKIAADIDEEDEEDGEDAEEFDYTDDDDEPPSKPKSNRVSSKTKDAQQDDEDDDGEEFPMDELDDDEDNFGDEELLVGADDWSDEEEEEDGEPLGFEADSDDDEDEDGIADDDDENEEDEEEGDDDEETEEVTVGSKKSKKAPKEKKKRSRFASAEDYAELLDLGSKEDVDPRELAWQLRNTESGVRGKKYSQKRHANKKRKL